LVYPYLVYTNLIFPHLVEPYWYYRIGQTKL
jgi:hypothetical protein